MRVPLSGSPQLFVQRSRAASFRSPLVLALQWRLLRADFEPVAYRQLVGSCLLHRLELMLAAL